MKLPSFNFSAEIKNLIYGKNPQMNVNVKHSPPKGGKKGKNGEVFHINNIYTFEEGIVWSL